MKKTVGFNEGANTVHETYSKYEYNRKSTTVSLDQDMYIELKIYKLEEMATTIEGLFSMRLY